MTNFNKRTYRRRAGAGDMVSFNVVIKETDLWVSAGRNLEKETRDLVINYRHQLESYIISHPHFLTALEPYPDDPFAPPMVKEMIKVTKGIGVGPMASVAGAIAQFVATGLLDLTDQVIVENGGDIYLSVKRPATVTVFAGNSPLSGKIGLNIPVRQIPAGICSSSGTVGHSLSMGIADVVCLVSSSAVLSDGAATALGNRVRGRGDLEEIADRAAEIEGISGGLVITGDRMAAWGDKELTDL